MASSPGRCAFTGWQVVAVADSIDAIRDDLAGYLVLYGRLDTARAVELLERVAAVMERESGRR